MIELAPRLRGNDSLKKAVGAAGLPTRSTAWLRTLEGVLSHVVWMGIVLILLTPFIVTPQTAFPFMVGKAVYSRVLIEIVFVCWGMLALLSPPYRPPRSWLLILLAVALGVAVLSACLGARQITCS